MESATEPEKGQLVSARGDAGLHNSTVCLFSQPHLPIPTPLSYPLAQHVAFGMGSCCAGVGQDEALQARPGNQAASLLLALLGRGSYQPSCPHTPWSRPLPWPGKTHTDLFAASSLTGTSQAIMPYPGQVSGHLEHAVEEPRHRWDMPRLGEEDNTKAGDGFTNPSKLGMSLQIQAQQQLILYKEWERPHCKPP